MNLAGSLVTKNQPIPQKIPPGWKYSLVKYLGRYINGYAFKPEDWSDEGKPILRIQNLSNPNASFNRYQGSLPEAYIVRNGDILISWSASLGVFQWTGENSWLNQHIFKVDVNRNLVRPGYFRWLASWFISEMAHKAHGSTMQHLTWDTFGSFPVLLPSLEEQCKIANYLDIETAKIDTLISAKERLLDLLTEKRRALITHAVTRGLNPSVLMCDSGLNWLGEIPAHWSIEHLKYHIARIEQGWSPQSDSFPADEDEWGVLKVGAVNGWEFNPDENKRLPFELEPLTEYEIKPGDILISRANTTELLGSASLVEQVRPKLLLCDKLYRLKIHGNRLRPEYLVFYLRSVAGRFEFERDATGASNSMQNISQEIVTNLWIPIPPINEQNEIVAHIKTNVLKLDNLTVAAKHTIELLHERRIALITAAVTGQISVTM